ncbi:MULTISPECIES: isochorismatase family protein [Catenuloplanes]|uniref:Bifunctional isochorismate lyase/aryl carrier protein n=1 Tax=Catenuloplanes niger TaxID=587534 RepID=A0AAE3ZTA6_9ACTN|nr:isochorismatase family protein [Catenuloplanes niger]MDR7325699.1 bifunctional isochorismate lyase/aryl carrier protein [Catenuloplanes niger]
MSIPVVDPYPLPEVEELPRGRVSWKVEPARAVLLVHDLQRHFLRYYTPGTSPLAPMLDAIAGLRARAAALGVPVVFSAQPGGQTPAQRGLQLQMWGDGVGPGAPAEIAVPLADGETLMPKWRYNAFHRTTLDTLMGTRDQLIICGVYAHIGVAATATDAFMRDIQAFVVSDAVADFSRADHDAALARVADHCGVVLPAADVFPT